MYHTERQAATSLSRRCSAESDDFPAVVRGTADCDPLVVDLWALVRGTADDELLAAPRRILRVEKPVDISMVVQGTVSCRLMAAIPSCEGVCIFRIVLEILPTLFTNTHFEYLLERDDIPKCKITEQNNTENDDSNLSSRMNI